MNTQILKSICLFFILSFAFTNYSNAQLIYTDIVPDYTLSQNTSYQLDLNNDGTNDLEFTYHRIAYGPCSNPEVPEPRYVHSYAIVSSLDIGFELGKYQGKPAAVNLTDTIWGGWSIPNLAILLKYDFNCYDGSGIIITGNWNSSYDHYLPIRFDFEGDEYYGWIRMVIYNSTWGNFLFTIKDFAYESTPNQPIFFDPNTTTGINEFPSVSNFSVFPNPFSHTTSVKFNLFQTEKVSLKIFDLNGRLIQTLADNVIEEGEHQMEINDDKMNAGMYFVQMQTAELSKTEKLVIKQF
jgi:hypothetical protein